MVWFETLNGQRIDGSNENIIDDSLIGGISTDFSHKPVELDATLSQLT